MPFKDITRESLEFLNQNFRSFGVQSLSYPPSSGQSSAPHDADYRVVDDFMRILPFVDVSSAGSSFARQYQVVAASDVEGPDVTYRGTAQPWVTGSTSPVGQELATTGTRFLIISATVRVGSHLGSGPPDDVLEPQIELAKVAVKRALGTAVLCSDPPDDDGAHFAGIPYYIPANSPQIVDYDAGRGLVGGLSELEARCTPGGDGLGKEADVFVMSLRSRWRLDKEEEDKGYRPDYARSDLFDGYRRHFHGKLLVTGPVPEGDAPDEGGSIYALCLSGESAVRVLHIGGDEYGVRVERRTTSIGLDSVGEAETVTNAVEVFGIYSLLVPDPKSVAMLKGVPVADPFAP